MCVQLLDLKGQCVPFPVLGWNVGFPGWSWGGHPTRQEGSCMGRTAPQHQKEPDVAEPPYSLPGLFCERNKTCVLFKLL